MKKNNNVSYKEVSFEGLVIDRNYKNPLTNVFQYEYAFYLVVTDLFQSVKCRSMCVGSLMLYFRELPKGAKEEEGTAPQENVKKSQKKLVEEMEKLVERDVIDHITFPMINICTAEIMTRLEEDGSHSFIFTDGVYAFSLHLDMPLKGHPRRIEVKDIPIIEPAVD